MVVDGRCEHTGSTAVCGCFSYESVTFPSVESLTTSGNGQCIWINSITDGNVGYYWDERVVLWPFGEVAVDTML